MPKIKFSQFTVNVGDSVNPSLYNFSIYRGTFTKCGVIPSASLIAQKKGSTTFFLKDFTQFPEGGLHTIKAVPIGSSDDSCCTLFPFRIYPVPTIIWTIVNGVITVTLFGSPDTTPYQVQINNGQWIDIIGAAYSFTPTNGTNYSVVARLRGLDKLYTISDPVLMGINVNTPTPTQTATLTPSRTFTGTATSTPSLAAPSDLVVALWGTNQLELRWKDNSSNEDYFTLQYRKPNTSNWISLILAGVNSSRIIVTIPPVDGTNFRIQANNATQESLWSNIATLTLVSNAENVLEIRCADNFQSVIEIKCIQVVSATATPTNTATIPPSQTATPCTRPANLFSYTLYQGYVLQGQSYQPFISHSHACSIYNQYGISVMRSIQGQANSLGINWTMFNGISNDCSLVPVGYYFVKTPAGQYTLESNNTIFINSQGKIAEMENCAVSQTPPPTQTATATSTFNRPPVGTSDTLNGYTGVSFTFRLSDYTDPDGDAITYSVTNLPNGVTFNPANNLLTGKLDNAGNYYLNHIGTDSYGNYTSKQVVLTIVQSQTATPTPCIRPTNLNTYNLYYGYILPGDSYKNFTSYQQACSIYNEYGSNVMYGRYVQANNLNVNSIVFRGDEYQTDCVKEVSGIYFSPATRYGIVLNDQGVITTSQYCAIPSTPTPTATPTSTPTQTATPTSTVTPTATVTPPPNRNPIPPADVSYSIVIESPFSVVLPPSTDPDGDPLTYFMDMDIDGTPIPDLTFDPVTRILSGTPKAIHYPQGIRYRLTLDCFDNRGGHCQSGVTITVHYDN